MGIICRYAKGRVDILSKEDHNEIRFECSIFWVKRLKRDISDLADKLGLELKIEIE
jgi:hypothetical protein